jgi:hypothetical protein
MGIQVGWDNGDNSTIRLAFEPGWTWNDLYGAIETADSMIVSHDNTVNLIIDIRKAGGIPGDFMRIAGDLFASGSARPNEGTRVVVGAGRLIRLAYNSVVNIYSGQLKDRRFLFASTLDEARELLNTSGI